MPAKAARTAGQYSRRTAQFVACLGAPPDRVLLGAGEHGHGLGEVAVGRDAAARRTFARVVASAWSDVDAGHRVPLTITGGGHRIDREHRPAGRAERGDEQPAGCFDRDRNRGLGRVAEFGEQLGELGDDLVDSLFAISLPALSTTARS
ncbi:hypothetical protein [Amycolatopsis sp. AA4]|uniref:hypothetical protein n=1 Tax=Amycolatopsis sp. AA4 TaxID=1896961 RepID=UPI001F25418E|nr:hypothetical protein [Amycolatopsis sp. AA4]